MVPIAHIENDFPTKFGIPRQSGRVGALKARIVFEPEYRLSLIHIFISGMLFRDKW